jgi:hypothetical protein
MRFAWALLFAAPLFGGCPGDLEHPGRFEGVPACRGNIDVPQLFEAKCGSAICHGGNSTEPAGDLDLTSPGVAKRLVGVPAHGCGGLYRVDPNDPDNSFLLGKLIEPPAGCGDRMPLVGILSAAEIACVRSWVHSIADTPVDGGTRPRDAGTDAGPISDGAVPPMDASMPVDASMPADASMPFDASFPFDSGTGDGGDL